MTIYIYIYIYIYNDTKYNPRNIKECDKRKSHISSKLHMICISSNNDRHLVTSLRFTTFHPATLHSTSLRLSTLHFFPFKLHSTTLHYTLI